MTPTTKKRAVSFTISSAALVTAMAWGAPRAAPIVNQHWVLRDTFTVFQVGLAMKAQRDSLNLVSELHELRRMVTGLDSSDRCRRGQREFCR
jgi:hypothetical protein